MNQELENRLRKISYVAVANKDKREEDQKKLLEFTKLAETEGDNYIKDYFKDVIEEYKSDIISLINYNTEVENKKYYIKDIFFIPDEYDSFYEISGITEENNDLAKKHNEMNLKYIYFNGKDPIKIDVEKYKKLNIFDEIHLDDLGELYIEISSKKMRSFTMDAFYGHLSENELIDKEIIKLLFDAYSEIITKHQLNEAKIEIAKKSSMAIYNYIYGLIVDNYVKEPNLPEYEICLPLTLSESDYAKYYNSQTPKSSDKKIYSCSTISVNGEEAFIDFEYDELVKMFKKDIENGFKSIYLNGYYNGKYLMVSFDRNVFESMLIRLNEEQNKEEKGSPRTLKPKNTESK